MNALRASLPRAHGERLRRSVRAGFACAVVAALAVASPAWCAWQTFRIADGLPSQQVRAIAEDRSEALWFGTQGGASRYDGVTFRNVNLGDVRCIFTDAAGRVWFGTAGGVISFDGTTSTTYTTSDSLVSNDVLAVLQDRAGDMWFGTRNGVSRFNGRHWVTYQQQPGGLTDNQVSCLFEDHAGNMWFGTLAGGVSRFDGTTWTTYKYTDGLAQDVVKSVFQTRDGVMWFGTQLGGLTRYDGVSWSTLTAAGSLPLTSNVGAMCEDRNGALWVSATTGVARFDGLAWRAYTSGDGLGAGNVSTLALDSSGNIWVGGDNGVSRYDGEGWLTFKDQGLGVSGATALLEDRTGAVWAATNGAGVVRYDRAFWTPYRAAPGGLAGDFAAAVLEDSTGAVWFGTTTGASRFDGVSWNTYTVADSLAGNNVRAMARDSAGNVWIGTTTGLSRFNGVTWRTFTDTSGLAASWVLSLAVDRAGRLWCGMNGGGVSVFDGASWTNYAAPGQLASLKVFAILQDHSGAMWFGTQLGLSRFDGTGWRIFTKLTDGLGNDWVTCMAEDRDSVLWVGGNAGGISRYDGNFWRTYTTTDGLPAAKVQSAMLEHSGNLWFGTPAGATLFEPDRVPPQTVITSPAPALSSNTLQTIRYTAAFRELVGIEYSTSLDSADWTNNWSTDDSWFKKDLADGVHTLQVRARDRLQHVDRTPALCTFEVDATGPAPVLTAPASGQAVRDTLVVRGTAEDARFRSLRVELRPSWAASWDSTVATTLVQSATPVTQGELARLATRTLPDGEYELRLSVKDTLGLTGVTLVTFIVDNEPPWAVETSPALVSAESGGNVYTTHREAHVFIPPHALARDALVHLDSLGTGTVPDSMPGGAVRVAAGMALTLDGVPLAKTMMFDLSVSGLSTPPGRRLVLYVSDQDTTWRRLGGTVDAANQRIETPASGPGRFAICAEALEPAVPGAQLSLSLTPRVFSPRGTLASPSIGIGFVLARTGTVNVTVHNRAGRLVRSVVSGATLGAGTNLVHWDGRDEDRHEVEEGLYLVTVEALGAKQVRALAVVR